MHIAHSEEGSIANTVFSAFEQHFPGLSELRRFFQNHLIAATYGAVKPIPNEYVLEAMNTYSENDVVLWLSEKYLDKPIKRSIQRSRMINLMIQ